MGDRFAAMGTVVDHEAEAGGEVEFFRDGLRGQQEVAEQGLILGGGFVDAHDELLGENEDVHRGRGLDVVNREAEEVQ